MTGFGSLRGKFTGGPAAEPSADGSSGRRATARLIATALSVVVSSAALSDQQDSASFAYLLHCAGCHLEDGSSDPPEIPDLRADLGLLARHPEGRSYMVRVPGITDATVTPQKMAELLNWMMTRFYPDLADFVPFTAAEVAAGKADPLYDPITHRRRLIAELTDGATPAPAETGK